MVKDAQGWCLSHPTARIYRTSVCVPVLLCLTLSSWLGYEIAMTISTVPLQP